ncbi:unnamed protein product [Euphydryas editha]|uniref:Transposase n=1 Tax=Euphydryas editha TaxID=104508 RepID=A0AAU9UM82_EUPED|nr:unnamed protein product [Euphydryas editha]
MESNKKPGRIGKVTTEELLKVLKLYIDKLPKDRKYLPGPTKPIWKEICSNHFLGRYNGRDVYRQCKENRGNIWTLLHPEENVHSSLNSTTNTPYSTNDSCEQVDSNDSDDEWEAPNSDTYIIDVPEDMYRKLIESKEVVYNNRTYEILTRGAWTDMIADEFYKIYDTRCAYVFKKGRVYKNSSSIHHVIISGRCKSKACGNKFLGFIDYKPKKFPCLLRVRTRDTSFNVNHEDVRRTVRKNKRKIIGKEASAVGSNNYLKRQVAGSTRIRPNIPRVNVVRQCVHEFTSNELGIENTFGLDMYNAIERMKDDERYRYFIHDLKKDKFYVFYSLVSELQAYKKYHHLMKIRKLPSVIAIDGTGSIVKEIIFNNGRKSGHIFLYVIVINFEGVTLSVHQLLTNDQSTILFEWWLKQWLKMGAPKPNEVRTDYSRALINAVSLTFNNQTIKTYIDTLFLKALHHKCSEMRPMIDTYVRVDVAHFIKMIAGWQSIKSVRNPVIKKFYLYTIALLVDAQNLKTFVEIFRHLCIICLNQYKNTILDCGDVVEDSRIFLEQLIKHRSYNFEIEEVDEVLTSYQNDENIATEGENEDQIRRKIEIKNEHENNTNIVDYEINPLIVSWITDIKESSEKVQTIGDDCNFFYNPDFIHEFMKTIVKEFPLWSAACLPDKNNNKTLVSSTGCVPEKQFHATTSFVEGYFNDKKHRVLSQYKNRISVKKFLVIEYQDLQGSSGIFQHNLMTNFNKDGKIREQSTNKNYYDRKSKMTLIIQTKIF